MSTTSARVDPTILIVDDSMVTRQVEKRILKSLGYERVVEATNGVQALERILGPGDRIGLILLDWNMPALNGIQFLAGLNKHPAGRRIPVIMVSAESTRDKILEAMCAGAKSYIIKPFHPNELRVKITEALRLAQLDEPRSALAGNLSDVGLPAIVQLASASRLSGRLAIARGGAPAGDLGFDDGEVTACSYGALSGDEAFLELAMSREGTFSFEAGPAPVRVNVTRPTMTLLIEAMRRQDEALRAA